MKSKYFLLANEPFVRAHIRLSRHCVFFHIVIPQKIRTFPRPLFAPQRNLGKSPKFRQTRDLIKKWNHTFIKRTARCAVCLRPRNGTAMVTQLYPWLEIWTRRRSVEVCALLKHSFSLYSNDNIVSRLAVGIIFLKVRRLRRNSLQEMSRLKNTRKLLNRFIHIFVSTSLGVIPIYLCLLSPPDEGNIIYGRELPITVPSRKAWDNIY